MSVKLLDKWLFLDLIMSDPRLPGSAKSAAFFLLDHLNTETERCDPSLDGLAERMSMSRRSVVDGIAALIEAGYLERVAGGGRGVRTKYRPCWETVQPASQYQDPETVKQSVINCEVERTKTVKNTSHETGNRNREETGNKNKRPRNTDLAPPEGSEKHTPARKKYAFEGEVIRLTVEHFDQWAEVYHGIPDLRAKLTALDAWCATHWSNGSRQRKDWFYSVPGMLDKEHQKMLAGGNTDRNDYWDEVDRCGKLLIEHGKLSAREVRQIVDGV